MFNIRYFTFFNSRNGLAYHIISGQTLKILRQLLIDPMRIYMACVKKLFDEFAFDTRIFESLGGFVNVIQYLNAVVPQKLRKSVMLLLSHPEIWYIVKQQSFEIVGNQSLHFIAQSVQQHLVKLAYLRKIMNSRLHCILLSLVCYAIVATITALIVCILFSASSNTLDCLDINTSSVTSLIS